VFEVVRRLRPTTRPAQRYVASIPRVLFRVKEKVSELEPFPLWGSRPSRPCFRFELPLYKSGDGSGAEVASRFSHKNELGTLRFICFSGTEIPAGFIP
jgi:hypothetical protein